MSLMYSERASIIIFIEQITINNTPMQINNAIFTFSLSLLLLSVYILKTNKVKKYVP